jgi:hypothetical protein
MHYLDPASHKRNIQSFSHIIILKPNPSTNAPNTKLSAASKLGAAPVGTGGGVIVVFDDVLFGAGCTALISDHH